MKLRLENNKFSERGALGIGTTPKLTTEKDLVKRVLIFFLLNYVL